MLNVLSNQLMEYVVTTSLMMCTLHLLLLFLCLTSGFHRFTTEINYMVKKKRKRSKRKPTFRDLLMYRSIDFIADSFDLNKFSMVTNEDAICQSYEGKLSKYTNMMKGWQFRWFILDAKTGTLSYFINETDRWKRPKGWMNLESAVISPSDEDPNTFIVNSIFGNCLKLRARDAKCRQDWVNRLRAVSQLHSSTSFSRPASQQYSLCSQQSSITCDCLASVKEHLVNAEKYRLHLTSTIDELPSTGNLQHIDSDLLTLKALSFAVVVSLNQCLLILQRQQQDSDCNKEES